MAEYSVHFTQTVSTVIRVEADDAEAAIEAAFEELPGSMCHQCARHYEPSGEWQETHVFDESDGGKLVWEDNPCPSSG